MSLKELIWNIKRQVHFLLKRGAGYMHKNDCQFMIDSFAKFHSYLYIEGWFYSNTDKLSDVSLVNFNSVKVKKTLGFDHGGVLKTLGPGLGFKLEVFFDDLPENYFLLDIEFITTLGKTIQVSLSDLANERLARSRSNLISRDFNDYLIGLSSKNACKPRVLDIGGRARSGLDRSILFPNCDVTVLDILPGDNVDVVGDAHSLSSLFPENYFDAVYSVSVFEHLLMPWKVVLEINKVLKPTAVGLIFTHQTIGMHDIPWDFYRFSDSAWDSLFNKLTGFEILDRSLDYTQYVIPFVLRPDKMDAEKSAGFEGSTVYFKKISSTNLEWNVMPKQIVNTMYPDVPDGCNGKYRAF